MRSIRRPTEVPHSVPPYRAAEPSPLQRQRNQRGARQARSAPAARGRRGPHALALLGLALGLPLALGCETDPGLRVEICGDLSSELDGVRLSILDAERAELASAVLLIAPGIDAGVPDGGPVERNTEAMAGGRDAGSEGDAGITPDNGQGAADGLSLTTHIPRSADAAFVAAEVLSEGAVTGRFERVTPGIGKLEAVQMVLRRACLGLSCKPGQTCVDGACSAAPGPGEPPRCGGSP